MSTVSRFEELLDHVNAGERLSRADLAHLEASADLLSLGMLADAVRRRIHGTQVTYVRVAACGFGESFAEAVPPAAREVRLSGTPDTLLAATAALERARGVAGSRTVSGWSWRDVERLASADGMSVREVLTRLRAQGLEALAEVPMDRAGGFAEVVEHLVDAGYRSLRLTVEKAPSAERTAMFDEAAALQQRYACIQVINPLPTTLNILRPSTGYDDVKMVAIARLAAPRVPTIQVDWLRYGPKLAQVALTFGADDLDSVSPFDDAPEGWRRARVEELRRSIHAAGFTPAERDGRFNVVST